MSQSVDQLIQEVFGNSSESHKSLDMFHNFDSSTTSNSNKDKMSNSNSKQQKPSLFSLNHEETKDVDVFLDQPKHPAQATTTTPFPSATAIEVEVTKTNHFDDSTEDDEGEVEENSMLRQKPACSPASRENKISRAHNTIFAVPFPLQPRTNLPSCINRCFLTNLASSFAFIPTSMPLPTVGELRKVAQGLYDQGATQTTMMLRKGAFYVNHPEVGNGCLDGNASAGKSGGCPNIVCCKCNYVVVRLQGAEWVDKEGSLDLYLTLRNYYPNWCRLASSYPVGIAESKGCELVLCDNPQAAAYCCQCSWLTVRSARVCIETKLTDVAQFATASKQFATKLPLIAGETRRPPLWICKGHSLA